MTGWPMFASQYFGDDSCGGNGPMSALVHKRTFQPIGLPR